MPEITLCRHSKQSINKDLKDLAVARKAADHFPEELAPIPPGSKSWLRSSA
jgi:hypothetical protein